MVSTPKAMGTPVSRPACWMPCGALTGDEVEVGGLAPDHAADGDDGVEAAGLGERLGHQRDLEGARHPHLLDVVVGDADSRRARGGRRRAAAASRGC